MVRLNRRLFNHIGNCCNIGAPDSIVDWITNGVDIHFSTHPEPFHSKDPTFNLKKYQFLQTEISKLLKDGVIIETETIPQYVSPIKCVPKRDHDKYRLIVDLSYLNTHVCTPRFQYDKFSNVSEIIQIDDKFTSFDLKDGFYHRPLSMKASSYFGFYFHGKYCRWCVCPFGWSSIPYYFHKRLRPIKRFLDDNGVRSSIFVDD